MPIDSGYGLDYLTDVGPLPEMFLSDGLLQAVQITGLLPNRVSLLLIFFSFLSLIQI